jgi:hypothetical protein
MDAAANTGSKPSSPDSVKSSSPGVRSGTAENPQRKEERLIALYRDLTGDSENAARSVYMHLHLGALPPAATDSRPADHDNKSGQ